MFAEHTLRWQYGIFGCASALAAILLSALTFATSVSAAACPNESIRETQTSQQLPLGTTTFPACMALEMVTPPKKFGQETFRISTFSEDGSRALFYSKAALAGTEGLQSYGGDPYVAVRDGGWSVSPTSPPRSAEVIGGGKQFGGPFAFSPTLQTWLSFGSTQAQRLAGETQAFTGGLGGSAEFSALSPLLVPIDDSGNGQLGVLVSELNASGTAENTSVTVFPVHETTTSYLPEDPRETTTQNSYIAFRDSGGDPTLQLLARDGNGKVWGGRCGARLGGEGTQGAISPDGSRIFFSTRPGQAFDPSKVGHPEGNPTCSASNPIRVMVRDGEGPQIEELLPGGPSEAGDDLFQAASRDGSKVLIASPRKLTASDQDESSEACSPSVGSSKGCDLYLYDEDLSQGSRLIQLSAGENVAGKHEAGKGANVLAGIVAASPDGSHAYFAAQGVLTADQNPQGASAQAGKPNLYLYQRGSGQLSFIGTLAEGDSGKAWGNGQSFAFGGPYPVPLLGGPEGGDGHILFLLSKSPLTGDDQDAGKSDVYRYDSSDESLSCISCAPGGPDSQPFDVAAGSSQGSTGSNFAELGRWASEDGQTVAFATGAALTDEDTDGKVNSYVWREGELIRLPGEIKGEVSYYKLPTVSPQGQEVGFTTTEALLAIDGDSTRDAYVVRVDGGFPNPSPSTLCDPLSETACQGPSSTSPDLPSAATPNFKGPANQTQVSCKKSQVKKRGRCVARKGRKAKKHRKSTVKHSKGRR